MNFSNHSDYLPSSPYNDKEIPFFMNSYNFETSMEDQQPFFVDNKLFFVTGQKNHLTEYYMDSIGSNEDNGKSEYNDEDKENTWTQLSSIEKLQNDVKILQKVITTIHNDNNILQKPDSVSEPENILSIDNIINCLQNMFMNTRVSYHDKDKNIIMFKRNNTKNILIQIFDDETIVSNQMVDSFIKYLTETNNNGIIVSNLSDFESKPDYFMENNYGNILIFVKNLQNNVKKIQLAINANDMIVSVMAHNEKTEQKCCIEKSVLQDVFKEYTQFQMEKEQLIETIKEEHRKTIHILQHNFKFTFIENLLSKNLMKLPKNELFKCNICNTYNAHNMKALSAHKRGCCKKHSKTLCPNYELEDYKN